jgi:hypothetical protein
LKAHAAFEHMFSLTKEQQEKLAKWKEGTDPKPCGAIGGRYTYSFTPTTLGVVVIVSDDLTDTHIDLSDYSGW